MNPPLCPILADSAKATGRNRPCSDNLSAFIRLCKINNEF